MDNKILLIKPIKNEPELFDIEKQYRYQSNDYLEAVPYAQGASYAEIAEDTKTDINGPWKTPLIFSITKHRPENGLQYLIDRVDVYLRDFQRSSHIDILSVQAELTNEYALVKILVRPYDPQSYLSALKNIFTYTGDDIEKEDIAEIFAKRPVGSLVVPENAKHTYTPEQIKRHEERLAKQQKLLAECTDEKPFLNSIDSFEPDILVDYDDDTEFIYDLKSVDDAIKTRTPAEDFQRIFYEVMNYVSQIDYPAYNDAVREEQTKADSYIQKLGAYIRQEYILKEKMAAEDLEYMLHKLRRSLFQLYIVQDLIDDEKVTDIKITAPNSIRTRIYGKAYLSNVNFVSLDDYLRFINYLVIRNNVPTNIPEQTFTDVKDERYILRFTISNAYINSDPWAYIHIRKVDRHKLLGDDLIEKGMMEPKVRDYLLQCGKTSTGVVFAGPPGSGKTVALNWFLEEAYESSAEILVIQENDELFAAKRKGVMFQHVELYPRNGEEPVTLEKLGQLALVAGANVFVIGEVKGAEICAAITLANSGCRTAITVHSPSANKTTDKMADLAMRGYAQSYEQAKRMLQPFQIIVYLENFQVKEISEVIGFDEEKKDIVYRCIYRREKEEAPLVYTPKKRDKSA